MELLVSEYKRPKELEAVPLFFGGERGGHFKVLRQELPEAGRRPMDGLRLQ
jgi:hypothetical protein